MANRRTAAALTVVCGIVTPSSPFEEFVRAHLPAPPARVLEVGCGSGELTTALAASGYDVLGIDPLAPYGDRFRRILLEDLDVGEGPFDAVVSSHAFHHIRDLDHAVDRVVALLRPGGVLVLDEQGWDRADEPTLDWLYHQRRALASAGHGEAPASLDALREEWEAEHVGLHGADALREALDARFEERAFAWTPFLYRHLGGVATEVLEQALVDAGAIRALGFRYAGVPRGS
jgi:SAM-dependent methyltransferase